MLERGREGEAGRKSVCEEVKFPSLRSFFILFRKVEGIEFNTSNQIDST